jgi:hypothetical protein
MPDYAKTIIYKLINYDYPELVYVGSTTNFTKRKQQHKQICLNEKHKNHNLKVYVNIRENDGWENWNMIKICDYPCDNKREAELKEDEYMTELKANMNMKRASRTQQQYREDNREKIQEYTKEYRDNNKEKIKEYYETNKEKLQERIKEYQETNKEKIKDKKKEYYETNKEKIQQYEKEYRDNNKEKIQEYMKEYRETNKENMKEKVKCECGCEVTKNDLKRHQKTKKHIKLMKCI